MNRVAAELRYIRAVLEHWSYRIRPYDHVADTRRWLWQPATPCGLGALTPDHRAALHTAAARYLEDRDVNLEQQAARDQALTVRCPYLPCLAQPGDPCVSRDGLELISQPAHVDRMRNAGVEILTVPTTADELADQPARTWTPTSALESDR